MVLHTWDLLTQAEQKLETAGSPGTVAQAFELTQRQEDLHGKFQASHGYVMTPFLREVQGYCQFEAGPGNT